MKKKAKWNAFKIGHAKAFEFDGTLGTSFLRKFLYASPEFLIHNPFSFIIK